MSTTTLVAASNSAGRRRRRAAAALGGVFAALVVYAFARLAAGHLLQPAFGSGDPKRLSAGFVAVVAALGALLGWAVIALLERASQKAARIWAVSAPLVLLASFSMPLSGHGVSGGNRLALIMMHLAVGAVVVPAYWASSPTRGRRA